MVTRADVVTLSDTDLYRFRNNVAVPPELIDSNNDAIRAVLNTAVQFVIDKVVAIDEENTFSENQVFNDGFKVALIEALTTNGNIIINTGTGKPYLNSAVSGNELQSLTQIQTLISTLTSANIDMIDGGIKTSNFNAVAGYLYRIDTSGGAFTGTLPASPAAGDVIGFVDIIGDCGVYNFTVDRNGKDIQDVSEDFIVNNNYYSFRLMYDATNGWYRI